MPSFKKKTLSRYIRSGCQRQLLLNLYTDRERKIRQLPMADNQRAGVGYSAEAGYDWQDKVLGQLRLFFPDGFIHENPVKGKHNEPDPLPLASNLGSTAPYHFLVEGEYVANTDTFRDAMGFEALIDNQGERLDIGDIRPDLIQVLPPMAESPEWEIEAEKQKQSGRVLQVLPDGNTALLPHDDSRKRLRVIDIKLAAEPGAHYFAEVVYYSLTLAAWLSESHFATEYVVVAAPAVWPGSYEDSALIEAKKRYADRGEELTPEACTQALEGDLEVAPFEVFAARLRQFFTKDLPVVLRETDWTRLSWHVNYKCNGCEFLGYPWGEEPTPQPNHCWPMAEREGHLSRVAGLSRGATQLLRAAAPDIAALAALSPEHTVFQSSQTLRTQAHLIPARARALEEGSASIAPATGSDALMPRYPDLRIFLFLDYDLASAVTLTLGIRASWREPIPFDKRGTLEARSELYWEKKLEYAGQFSNRQKADPPDETIGKIFVVPARSPKKEAEQLLLFLRELRRILTLVAKADEKDIEEGRREKPSTYQFYLWDEAQRKHLARIMGRHLAEILADPDLGDLAWLFPPPDLLAHPEEVSYNSPFTLVSRVAQNTLAAAVPHHYTLLKIAQHYRPEGKEPPRVSPLYTDPLSDLIPPERIYEAWLTKSPDWLKALNRAETTTRTKLYALWLVAERLQTDLKDRLNSAAAPPVTRPKRTLGDLAPQGLLWYEFVRLNAALSELEGHAVRAMPPHEREARFKSAHLKRRLEGDERTKALEHLRRASTTLGKDPENLIVYELSDDSRDFNVRPPQMGFVLTPKSNPGFLNSNFYALLSQVLTADEIKPTLKDYEWQGDTRGSVAKVGVTEVAVQAMDRVAGWIALKPGRSFNARLLEELNIADLASDVMLDPVSNDFLSTKIDKTLKAIGWPESAQADSKTARALGIRLPKDYEPSLKSPAAEFLWEAKKLASTDLVRDTGKARAALTEAGEGLNPSQWEAWEAALTRRLTLVWGPPGTGKSQTLRAVIAGAILAAKEAGQPLRILVSSHTYNAVDNVLFATEKLLREKFSQQQCRIYRLQGEHGTPPEGLENHPGITFVPFRTTQAPLELLELQATLETSSEIVLVGAPSHQIYNLGMATKNKSLGNVTTQIANTKRPWFDLVIIDEASQLDVAESILIVSKAAEGAAFILAGDDLQLPPIHQATAPEGLEYLVGSVYSYVRHLQGVEPMPLQTNYRSNSTLVDFFRRAGYDAGLEAYSPDLRLRLLGELPAERPEDWPESLIWTPDWCPFLDPTAPAACFVYVDELASQANDFEADAIAAILYLLYGRLANQLDGERDRSGNIKPSSDFPYDQKGFWESAVGVVTPHKAQMARVVRRLQEVFPEHEKSAIWQAVDTVERFQGQQRDVIIASFGLGDPDLIQAEDEFLFNLNRLNVMASRARAKLIVLTTRSLVDHVADDAQVLEHSRLIKSYVDTLCKHSASFDLGYLKDGQTIFRTGELREWRGG